MTKNQDAAAERDTTGFIAPLIYSHDAFTLIEGMAAHLRGLLFSGLGIDAAKRFTPLLDQITAVAADGKEEISTTGLSWQ